MINCPVKVMLRQFFLLFLVFTSRTGISQTYYFENYSAADGLESKVYAIVQDENRYVWLGTRTGLTKFDGKTFANYTVDDGLAPMGVRVLCRDKRNTIWLGHEGGGVTRLNKGKFEIINLPDTIIKSHITSITEDHQQQIWITTAAHGALRIKNPDASANALVFEHYFKGKKLGDMVYKSLATADSSIYFITYLGIKEYNPSTDDFDNYAPEGIFRFFSFTAMFEDSRKNLWFGTYNGGLYKYDQVTKKFEYLDTKNGLAANWITTITEDRQHNIWVGHWDNDKNKGGITKIESGGMKIFNTHNGLHDNWIWCITEDMEGNILIGTTDHGLDIFKGEQFVAFTKNDGLQNDRVSSIIEDKRGQIWFGTAEGISVYHENDINKVFLHYNQSNSFISNQIRIMQTDRSNNIWIGTDNEGLVQYNTELQRFISQPWINNMIERQSTGELLTMEIDQNNFLWVGKTEGLFQFDLSKKEYVKRHSQDESHLSGTEITALFADSKNNLFIGCNGKGVNLMKNGKVIKSFEPNVTPSCIAEAPDGRIWIGTENHGILVYQDTLIRKYTIDEGLLSNLINTLVFDEKFNAYVGTNKGLNIIDINRNHIFTYTRKNGFTGIETNINAGFRDRKGNIWIGTTTGAIKCNSAFIKATMKEPLVQITDFKIKGESAPMEENLRLGSIDNDISFSFISICLTNPDAVRYRILLEGLHDEWQELDEENTVVFNKLQHGRYTFNVIARNDEGIWNSIPARYHFRILAPFYQRGWFITTLIVILISSIVAYIKIRERNLIREKRVLEDRVKERTQALSIANDELAMKNKDILDSITYAKRIQLSILPPDVPFDHTFILFKPKDIVSGDFYWLTTAGGKEFLSAVDCTGHGVPGAFMSFIGHTSLNKIVIEQGIYQPAEILNKLNEEVAHTLHQKGEDIVNDGMDIALISYDPALRILEYAGAFNPLVLIRNGEILETKADRFAIGRATGKENKFTNHIIEVQKGDTFYMFSDGYADQFGGPESKKFKTANLKELFVSIQGNSMEEQRSVLDNTIENWRGGHEQIDDILVMGRRFV
jgi:ligand-binding sensor domain-containing protein/serine phosphatase RsbU (regulator of sigma subunit)